MQNLVYLASGALILGGVLFQIRLVRRLIEGNKRSLLLSLRIPFLIGVVLILGVASFGVFQWIEDSRPEMVFRTIRIAGDQVWYFNCVADSRIVSFSAPNIVSEIQLRGDENCKLPLWGAVHHASRWAVIVALLFLAKSLISPLASGAILSYTLFQYHTHGVISVFPVIEASLDLAFGSGSASIQIAYTILFLVFSLATMPLTLTSAADATG